MKQSVLMKISLLIIGFVLIISCQIETNRGCENGIDLSLKIDSIVNKHNFNGVVLVSADSMTIYSKAVGFSDLENKIRLNLNDQFVIGSISKQITAVMVLQVYEKGKLRLDDTVNQYLTEINQPWAKEVTIHQLLTHTHGIINVDKPLKFKQGTQFSYSQIGYELLAQILEKVSGCTFEKLSTEFFETYGLQNTFHPDNNTYKHLVKGYEETDNGVLEYATQSLYNYVPAGSFISNTTDLKRWNELLYSEKLFKQDILDLMRTKYATRIHPIFGTVEYGYGLLFKDGEQNVQIGALGYAPGFASACYYYPKSNIDLIVLENIAHDLNDFKQTFKVHTEIMKLIKNQTCK